MVCVRSIEKGREKRGREGDREEHAGRRRGLGKQGGGLGAGGPALKTELVSGPENRHALFCESPPMFWKWSSQLLGPSPVAYAQTCCSARKPGHCSRPTAFKHTHMWGLTACLTMTLSQVPKSDGDGKNSLAGCRLRVLD